MSEFTKRIKMLRLARRMRQHDMDDKLGLGHGNYCRYELGYRDPDMQTLIKMADIYRVSIDYMVGRVDTPYYIYNKEQGKLIASNTIPTDPATEPILVTDIDWLPKNEDEFKAYIIKLMQEKNGG